MKRATEVQNTNPDEAGLDDDAFQNVIAVAVTDAISYIDEDVAPDREAATAYYRGDPLGNEEDGRSKVVMTEVRDVVQAILPSLLRVFLGSENVAEFTPTRQDTIAQAEQATDYVNHILRVDNPGFEILFGAFKDALIRKVGVITWYVDESKRVVENEFSGMSQEDVEFLQAAGPDEDLEVLSAEEDDPDPENPDAPPTMTIRVRRTLTSKRFVVEVVPPEEFLVSREARDLDTSPYVGRRRELPLADVVAMGYDLNEVIDNAGTSTGFEMNTEREARNPVIDNGNAASEADPMMRKVLYTESYIRCDRDGDGIAELRRVCTLGDAHHILHDEIWDGMVPIALFCPDPEPHMVIGYSMADQVADLQEIKTAVVRNTLDSLANAIHPDTAILDGAVNYDDALNTEVGRLIRIKQIGAYQPMQQPFIGPQALEVINYLDRVRAQRTGITEATQGLDPDALQSTTKAAVTAATQAAQQRLEMIARIFAETGLRRLMRGLLRLVIAHQDEARIVRLRGSFVPVDPRYWDADMDVAVDPALGTGNVAERVAALQGIFQTQVGIIQQLGPDNPLCGFAEVRHTLGKMVNLQGFKDDSRFFKPFGQAEAEALKQQQAEAAKNAPPPSDPASMLAQVEQSKVAQRAQSDSQKLQLQAMKAQMDDDRERDRMAQDFTLKSADLANKQITAAQERAMRFEQERQRNMMGAAQQQPAPQQPGGA
jgi:hypothetical protein